MDQSAFRNLLSAPRDPASASSSSSKKALGGHAPRRGWGLKPKDTKAYEKPKEDNAEKNDKPSFAPRATHKKILQEGGYKDRAALRRKGVDDEYKPVEKLLEDFERTAKESGADDEEIRKQRAYLGGDAEHSILVKGLDYALLAARKAELAKENEDVADEELEALSQGLKPAEAKARAERKRKEADKKKAEAERLGKGFRSIGQKEPSDGEKKKKKKKKKVVEDLATATASRAGEDAPKPTVKMEPSANALPGPSTVPAPKVSTGRTAAVPEPEAEEEEDIFADAGEYDLNAGLPSDEDDEDAKPAGTRIGDRRDGDSSAGRYGRHGASTSRSRSRSGDLSRDRDRHRYDESDTQGYEGDLSDRRRGERSYDPKRFYSRSRSRSRSRDRGGYDRSSDIRTDRYARDDWDGHEREDRYAIRQVRREYVEGDSYSRGYRDDNRRSAPADPGRRRERSPSPYAEHKRRRVDDSRSRSRSPPRRGRYDDKRGYGAREGSYRRYDSRSRSRSRSQSRSRRSPERLRQHPVTRSPSPGSPGRSDIARYPRNTNNHPSSPQSKDAALITRGRSRSPTPLMFATLPPPLSRSPSPSSSAGGSDTAPYRMPTKLTPLSSSAMADVKQFLSYDASASKADDKRAKKAAWRAKQGLGVQEGVDPESIKRKEGSERMRANNDYVKVMRVVDKGKEA